MTTGKCKHGNFELEKGCEKCIAERRRAGIRPEQDEMEDGLNAEGLTMAGTSLVVLRPGADVEAMNYHDEAQRLLEYANSRVITTAEDNRLANDDLSVISKLKKAMEAKRKAYLEPLKQQQDAIRDTYDYLMGPVLEADKITRNKMVKYDAEQRRIRAEQEEINRLKMEAAKKEMALNGELSESVDLVEVMPEVKRVSTDFGTSGMRPNWQWEVVDFALVPDTYKVIDNAQLTAIARRHHDTKKIDGVRFYNDPIIVNRAR